MREIKFRGKTKLDNKWIYGDFLQINNNTYIQPASSKGIAGDGGFMVMNPVYPESVGQYIGFEDEKKKEIYEGDIMKFWDSKRRKVCMEGVYWEHGAFRVNGRKERQDWGKVIANMFDNPELKEI